MRRYVVHIILACSLASVVFAGPEQGSYIRADRPGKGSGPTPVYFYVFLIDISDIDGHGQFFSANIFLSLRWKEERLAHEDDSTRTVPLAEVWNPRLVIVNQQGVLRMSLPKIVEVQPDGTVTYLQRYNGTFSQPLKLSEFPFDQHRFTITFGTAGYSPKDVQFMPDSGGEGMEITGGDIRETLSLPDWAVTDYKVESRPHVSNDNPFSESQFKTMKYRPEFPSRFGCIEDARAFAVTFFNWYNQEHRHSGIGLYTPSDVHHGRTGILQTRRQATLDEAYLAHPERFVRKRPHASSPPEAVWINPPESMKATNSCSEKIRA